jgi:thiamine-monophosphate kinase
MPETLRDRGERALLEEIRRLVPRGRRVLCGPGDDTAVLARSRHPLLFTTDAMVEGVHFRRGWLTPRELGRRVYEVNASDIAAMGGRPLAALLAVAARPDLPAAELRGIVAGVRDGAAATGAALAGGNLAAARALSLTVALLGDAPAPPVRRASGRPGDQLFVTGELGGAALGLRRLLRTRTIRPGGSAVRRWRRPVARLRAGALLAHRRIAAAMIDLSDGLLVDTARLCRASRVGAVLSAERLPVAAALRALPARAARRLALAGGEDYELLFAVRPRDLAALARLRPALGCRLSHVGELVRGGGVRVVDARGRALALPARAGHGHFGGR